MEHPWNPPPRGWQDELIEAMPPGVDATQIAENLKLTPTERLERMLSFRQQLEELRQAFVDSKRRQEPS